jgi:hypothetical protein
MALCVVIAAVSVPMLGGSLAHFQLSGAAHGVSNSIAVAKMRAAAHFTQTRFFADLAGDEYHLESWDKDAGDWVVIGGVVSLPSSVTFGFGLMEEPPPNTQADLDQAALCLDEDGVDIAKTACVVFNSRGVPIDSTGTPTPTGAIYVESGSATYGATVSATGLVRLWRADTEGSSQWSAQ